MRYKIVGDNLQMVIIELEPGEVVYAEAGALNHMSSNVEMETKVKGGIASIHACGDIIEYSLEPGQALKVDTGHIIGFESTVDYDITPVKGIKSMLFGGEGIFLAKLTGPGKVYLQSMTLRNLAAVLNPYLTKGTSGGGGIQFRFGI